mgnify:CR=1 FL=1
MANYRYSTVDVFTAKPLYGNALAVVHDAQGLTDVVMQKFTHWTNLSETTFLLPPTDPAADYRLRIASVARDYGMNERAEAPKDSRARHG